MLLGLKLQLQLQTTEAFRKIGAEPSPHSLPGGQKVSLYSDQYLEQFARHQTTTGHHPTSTCKMGSVDDTTAVVDSKLR